MSELSLFRLGLAPRLLIATGLSAIIWLVVLLVGG